MVGTGKTTLTSALAARFGLQMALESVDGENPWLESFYGGEVEMRTYALHLQLHFLATRFASMRRMRGLGGSWILDRTWYEDAEIFARGLFEQGLMTSGRVDALPPTLRRASLFAGGPAAATTDLFARAAPSDPRAYRHAWTAKGARCWRGLLGRAARPLRNLDRPIPALPCAAPRRSRIRLGHRSECDRRHRGPRSRGARGRVAADGAVAGIAEEARAGVESAETALPRNSRKQHGTTRIARFRSMRSILLCGFRETPCFP